MLTEERQQLILQMLQQKGTLTVGELVETMDASESTIRRDLSVLDERGSLKKIHGGAMLLEGATSHVEYQMERKQEMNSQQKEWIAKKAASLIEDGDVFYIDAGTTTEKMIEYIKAKDLVAVTNGIGHVQKLVRKGIKTIILGGSIKMTTEAVVGVNAVVELGRYQFAKGFFGTNGVSSTKGLTTPDLEEAAVKQKALGQCDKAYVLADASKVGEVSFVRFGEIDEATLIISGEVSKSLHEQTTIIEVDSND